MPGQFTAQACRHRPSAAWLLWLSAVVAFPPVSPAIAVDWKADREPPIAEFKIAAGDQVVLLPVRISDRQYEFVLDTGSSLTILDASLREDSGAAASTAQLQTPSGVKTVQRCECPEATLGPLKLRSENAIACCDLESLRRATGRPIMGVLGMDFLQSYVVQLDFDSGMIRFFGNSRGSHEWGERLPLDLDHTGRPCTSVMLPSNRITPFLIDTGATGKTLEASLFDRLVEQHEIVAGATTKASTLAGEIETSAGRLSRLTLGSFKREQLVIDRDQSSLLGLDYLRRYQITFDFPRRAIYLRPGKQFSDRDSSLIVGCTLAAENGKLIVDSVTPDGPAACSGMLAGDGLQSIDNLPVSAADMLAIKSTLAAKGQRPIRMSLQRGDQLVEITVIARDRFPAMSPPGGASAIAAKPD